MDRNEKLKLKLEAYKLDFGGALQLYPIIGASFQ